MSELASEPISTTAKPTATDDVPRGTVGRRRLLLAGTGIAGAIVGAGAATGIAATTQPGTTAMPKVSPNEELMYDHGILKRVLLCYRELSRRLGGPQVVTPSVVTAAAEIIRDFIESYHEGLEEAYVFPRLVQANRSRDVVTTLLAQHDRGRHITAAILDLAADGLATPTARATLKTDLDLFVRMYEPHEAWEDTVIFPTFREITPDATWRALADKFASEQERLFGRTTLADLVDRVSTIETTLGVHDLSSFTPDGPA